MTTTTYTPMPEQPPSDGRWYAHYPKNEGQWMNVVECGYKVFYPPHQPGDRVGQREEWFLRWVYQPPRTRDITKFEMTVEYRDGQTLVHLATLNNPCRYTLGVWQPADTLPDFAIRTYLTVLSCEPELCDGVWRWKTTYNEGDKS